MIAALLILKRVANRSALTGSIVITGTISSLKFRSGGVSTGGSPLPSGSSVSSVDTNSCEKGSGVLGVGVGATVDLHQDIMV